jgi:hypothetical protein
MHGTYRTGGRKDGLNGQLRKYASCKDGMATGVVVKRGACRRHHMQGEGLVVTGNRVNMVGWHLDEQSDQGMRGQGQATKLG